MSLDWYVINTTFGCENKVAKAIREEAIKKGVNDIFEEIIVPTESYVEIKRGKKIINTKKKILPGYIIIKMHMNENTWGLVKRIPNVAKFLGADNRPAKVSEKEVERILKKVEESNIAKNALVSFELHEVIRITDGPFETFTGVIEEVDKEKLRLRVLVSILGRDAPVELEFDQVEKIL